MNKTIEDSKEYRRKMGGDGCDEIMALTHDELLTVKKRC